METPDSDIVFQSYGRCCNNPQFFVDFYDRFMGTSTDVRDMFRDTDMKQQRHLLRNGIMQLILVARGMPDSKLRALGQSHSRSGYNVRPELYSVWLDALMDTVARHDAEFSPAIDGAWRRAIQPGIEMIRNAY
ncbi:globin [Microbulbifer yueqingensis]|uniref:Globin domain-containing protein n=1 Tax=Microbulbifer yueqingensis TaxID=658219 RepID=A0A1G9DM99_9GAMM|nr:globin [Microbulbifer yueqingensis]SDK65001.1 hypothetical protein SAMN05216212_2870 [Microbulbifer yueqingensis]